MSTIGLDAVCFLRFLRMCRNMYVVVTLIAINPPVDPVSFGYSFLVTAALTCAVLIPINVIYNLRNVSASNRNYLLILTMAKVRGNYLW
jgi:calcium permeable stress-gated cation channel